MAESPVKELDELTRLRIELRAEKDKKTRKPLFHRTEASPLVGAIAYAGVAWSLDPVEFRYLLTYIGAVAVAVGFSTALRFRTDARLMEIERRLNAFEEELKKRN
jgi:hypothetical protein